MKSGIYKITNKTTNRFYIGSAINFDRRKLEHFRKLRNDIHENIHLQRLYNKYGEDDFEIELILECEKQILLQQEQIFINNLNPEINICKTAGSSLGRFHSKESREKMSVNRKGKRFHSDYQIQRIKETHINKIISDKVRFNKARSILQISQQGEVIKQFRSISEAVRETGINNIGGVLRGFQQTAGGFKWKYETEYSNDIENISSKQNQKIINIKEGRIQAGLNIRKPVLQLDLDLNTIQEFDSIKSAEIAMCGEVKGNISNCIRGLQKTAYKFKWKFKNK